MQDGEPRVPEPRTAEPETRDVPPLARLDDRSLVERLDPHGLLGRIVALPDQCEEAWQGTAGLQLPDGYADAREVVALGMGGSAISGDILRSLADVSGGRAVSVVRGYDLPSFAGEQTVVIACSHSGDTEETLSAFEQAVERNARTVVVTTGGRLLARAREVGIPALAYEYDGEPRSALGHQLMRLLAIGERLRLVAPQGEPVAEAVRLMREQRTRLEFAVPARENAAKQLAGRLHGRLPLVIGSGVLAQAAHRWKTQLNENAKTWSLYEELPELDHNAVVGFGLPAGIAGSVHAVFLWHASLYPRMLLRYEATAEELERAGVSHERVEALGSSPLAQALTAVFLGDLVSYYLALLYGVQPSPVAPIDRLKAKLAQA